MGKKKHTLHYRIEKFKRYLHRLLENGESFTLNYTPYQIKIERNNFMVLFNRESNITSKQSVNYDKGSLREHIPKDVKEEVYKRDEGVCVDCGNNDNLENDHIIPVLRG